MPVSLPAGLRRSIIKSAARNETWLIALDFDGTLAPLRRAHAEIQLSHKRRKILQRLASLSGVRLLIVSGRELEDLRRRCLLRGAAFSGEHGMNLIGVGTRWAHPGAVHLQRHCAALAGSVERLTKDMRGVEVEEKRTSITVHWRNSAVVRRAPEVLGAALSEIRPHGWRVAGGKCVWEFRPDDARGKGDVILLARDRIGAGTKVLFIGDDRTDEEGFRRLGRGAWTVRVGPGVTAARWRVGGLRGVDRLLTELAQIRGQAVFSAEASRTRPRSSTRRAPQR